MDVAEFIHEHFGRHLSAEPFGWALKQDFFLSKKGGLASLRGPSGSVILVTPQKTWIKTPLTPSGAFSPTVVVEKDINLKQMAFRFGAEVDWALVAIGKSGPNRALPGKPYNPAGVDHLVMYEDSGRKEVRWSKSLAMEIAALIESGFPWVKPDDKSIKGLIDQALREQYVVKLPKKSGDAVVAARALRSIRNLLVRYPAVVMNPSGIIACVAIFMEGK